MDNIEANNCSAPELGLVPGSPFWVFELNDCEWYTARNLEEAKSHYLLTISDDEENVRDARALTDEEMDRLVFWSSESRDPMDFDHWRCDCGAKADGTCRWNGTAYEHPHEYPVGHLLMKNVDRMTFRERLAQLVADGQSKPEFFATTEW
jgi:hypothetical protein